MRAQPTNIHSSLNLLKKVWMPPKKVTSHLKEIHIPAANPVRHQHTVYISAWTASTLRLTNEIGGSFGYCNSKDGGGRSKAHTLECSCDL